MALKKVDFAPGFNKQSVPSALPGQWVDGDFVRFRYTAPEKIGGWEQLTAASKTLPGAARAQLTWTSLVKKSGNNGLKGLSINLEVNVSYSVGLASLLKYPPGIFPAA